MKKAVPVLPAKPTVSPLVPNAFIGRTGSPTEDDLSKALGAVKPIWDKFVADMAARHDVKIQEWKSYSIKAGWSLRLLRGKRTIVWMAPCQGSFRVAFVLGDKAVLAARQSGFSAEVLRMLDQAERYPEGTGVRFQVKDLKYIPTLHKLAEIKLAN